MAKPLVDTLIPPKSQLRRWIGGFGSANSKRLAELVGDSERLFVFIANDAEGSRRVSEEMRFFNPGLEVMSLPDHETLPYDTFSPPVDLLSDRLAALYRLPHLTSGMVVLSMRTVLKRVPPKEFVQARSMVVEVGDRFDMSARRNSLIKLGYRVVNTVYEPGEFAIRGSIFDVFAIGVKNPLRIELFDEEISSLRLFDTESQRTTEQVESIEMLPAKEFSLDAAGIDQFRDAWHHAFDVDVRECRDYQSVSEGVAPEGIESYLPLFFSELETVFDYLSVDPVVVLDDDIDASGHAIWREINERFESLRFNPERPLLPPHDLYLRLDELKERWNHSARIQLAPDPVPARHAVLIDSAKPPDLETNRRSSVPALALRDFIQATSDRVLLVAETLGRREFLLDFLARSEIRPEIVESLDEFIRSSITLGLTVAPIDRFCVLDGVAVITELQLFGTHSASVQTRERHKVIDPDLLIRNVAELNVGAHVVHLDHGIARYQGLEIVDIGSYPQEFVTLEYEAGDKLYLPVASLHLISRYVGARDDRVQLSRLGSTKWQKTRERAAAKIRDVAAELLNLYARRELATSHKFPPRDTDYARFCDQCEFELTDDQSETTEAIIADLCSERSTDRIVCGDVGFGKTEVAMRAAFHVVQHHKQVAVLVPTTLLAQQHFDTFSDRFASWPVQVALLSRMRTMKEAETVKNRVRNGQIDIVIGTHQLLSDDIEFDKLGLLIVDEEHRFGVRHKERIRNLKAEVDLLTLTATPIPRTLNMTLEGLRDISVIATPPAKRLAIRTFVQQASDALIRDAINRELDRGGQTYFLHNRIQTIGDEAERLQELVPRAKLAVAHGAMPKQDLENVMSDFYHRRCNLLLCTTIIESGIDVPNANTIVVARADKFGLAQLHQLRGRVGRSHRQAYAYLLTPPESVLTRDAVQRLEAIQAADELGAGFMLAMQDLEIRGAGELLGEEQSGQIEGIGFSLYMQMLERTVEAMRSNRVPDLERPFELVEEVDFHVPAYIPSDYLPDVRSRLILYKRLANARTNLELDHLQVEIVDRFGELPQPLQNLVRTTRVKLAAAGCGIRKVDASPISAHIEFVDATKFDAAKLIQMVQASPLVYRFSGESKLQLTHAKTEDADRFLFIEEFIDSIRLNVPARAKAA